LTPGFADPLPTALDPISLGVVSMFGIALTRHEIAPNIRLFNLPESDAMDAHARQLAEMVKMLLAVPDQLLTAQLSLRSLSHSDLVTDPTESINTIADACDLIHLALTDAREVARNLADLSDADAYGVVLHPEYGHVERAQLLRSIVPRSELPLSGAVHNAPTDEQQLQKAV